MPPRPKRTRLHPARATTRSQAQAAQAPNNPTPAPAKAGPSAEPVRPQRTRSNLIMEVVLPASKKPTPKTSSAPTPESFTAPDPSPAEEEEIVQEMLLPVSPSLASSLPVKESTPRPIPAQDKGKQKMGSLPPSSPPPASSPELGPTWDHSSHGSTPTPSPSRSRQVSRQIPPEQTTVATVLVPGTPSSSQPPPTEPTQLQQLPTPTSSPPPFGFASAPKPSTADELQEPELEEEPEEEPEPQHKPPTSPIPYSDSAGPNDPFGFFAAEDRLKERRAALERDDPAMSYGMPSSGGPEDFDQSTYEEAFASIFYDPHSGTITGTQASTTGSDKENVGMDTIKEGAKGKGKKTMEVVIPTKAKEKEKEKEPEKEKETMEESPRVKRGRGKAKEKDKERVLTTYELEAMLPRRPKRTRKPRTEEAEKISLSDEAEDDDDEEEEESPKRRRRTASSRGKATSRGGAVSRGTRGRGKKVEEEPKAKLSKKSTKAAAGSSKRIRSFDTSHMDEETRERFEAERDRRLEAYKALDNYRLEEEEVVW